MVVADGMSATGMYRHGQLDRILANPKGWSEWSGASWLSDAALQ